ncbi:phospholipase A1-II 1-like [Impatiens glandulifera]|uniref:phospholipase A1-II 1-like n=1 Tax=Impatiens glandulifera TaxID=253017 RepID=UPI001FB06E78|nr:phospholipase A1-II 1-like [Impatiens glandulifera]
MKLLTILMKPSWREMSGENNWKGMLRPLNDDLRQHIIHYGEMAQATYDSYDSDDNSRTGGNCKHAMDELFSRVGLHKGRAKKKYIVTKYIYASACSWPFEKDTNWMGYVAVSTDEAAKSSDHERRDIVVSWRGSHDALEWMDDLEFWLKPAPLIFDKNIDHDEKPEVHSGFYSIYTLCNNKSNFCKRSAREQVLDEITRLMNKYEDEEISVTVTGHSLGAALTTLSAVDIAQNISNRPNTLVTAFAFASPRVGNSTFAATATALPNLRILRIENRPDLVPDLPPCFVGFTDVGQELLFDTSKSCHMKYNLLQTHNLEVYLHGIEGTQGLRNKFKEVVERDITLLNKYGDNLKDLFGVPENWWEDRNRVCMVQLADGSWKVHCENISLSEVKFGLVWRPFNLKSGPTARQNVWALRTKLSPVLTDRRNLEKSSSAKILNPYRKRGIAFIAKAFFAMELRHC